MSSRTLFALSLAVLGACASPAPKLQTVTQQNPDPAVLAALQVAKSKSGDYRIAPQDQLEIIVYQESDLTRTIRVDQTGKVNLPLIGTATLGDLSVRQAEEMLQKSYAAYLVNPQVNIFIKEYHRKQVFILGEVQKPGTYDFPSETGMTVLEAVALAGGFTKVAAPDKTRVVRNEDGAEKDFVVPAASIMKGGAKAQDLPLEPSDIIYVPQSLF